MAFNCLFLFSFPGESYAQPDLGTADLSETRPFHASVPGRG